jgi:glycerol-3-phosphate acyltransferase PlsY
MGLDSSDELAGIVTMMNRASTLFLTTNQRQNMQGKRWRRLWHLLGGSFFPITALFIPREILLIILGALTGIFVAWEISRFAFPGVNRWMVLHLRVILKEEERFRLTGTTYLLLSSLAVFLLFDKYVAIASLLFLSIGDLMATVIGEKFGKRIVFNKSLEGSFACLVSCLVIGIVMTRAGPAVVLPVAIVGAVSATIVELLPIPVDDNLTIPLFSAGMMTLAMLYFG